MRAAHPDANIGTFTGGLQARKVAPIRPERERSYCPADLGGDWQRTRSNGGMFR